MTRKLACMVTSRMSHNTCHTSQVVCRGPNAVVTPLRKAASYEPRIAILGIWGDTWLTRGKYGIYVVVTGALRGLRDAFWKFCHVKSALSTVVSPNGNEDTLVGAA